MSLAGAVLESGIVPDPWVRASLRSRLAFHLERARRRGDFAPEAQARLRARLRAGPIAAPAAVSARRTAAPAQFFGLWLGPRMSYSCGLWPHPQTTLAESEEAMLELTCQRAGIVDGMRVLDLGAGWGPLAIWIAQRYPNSSVQAISNSEAEVAFLRARAADRGLRNVRVECADASRFTTDRRFDRVVSVEMFEHLRNHDAMLGRAARWLAPGGRLFVHALVHRAMGYLYDTRDADAWMARHFFTGGVMPSEELLSSYDQDLVCEQSWAISGREYARTIEAWLARLDSARDLAAAALARAPGRGQGDLGRARRQVRRWRVFLMACAELFGWNGGEEWRVGHYRFAPRNEESPGRSRTS